MAKKFQENVDKLLECPFCLERIKQPKMLNCQHSFCFDPCLKDMAQKNGTSYSLECSICGKKCKIENLKKIPENLHLKNLLDIKRAEEQNKTHEMGTYIECTVSGLKNVLMKVQFREATCTVFLKIGVDRITNVWPNIQ